MCVRAKNFQHACGASMSTRNAAPQEKKKGKRGERGRERGNRGRGEREASHGRRR